jgi:hypothetical protein
VTSIAVKDVGFCAHFSRQGDWAFEFALSTARRLDSQLNIFYFPRLNCPDSGQSIATMEEEDLVALDRKVREYYDDKLGDFVEAGFRVCEDLVDRELRRCLFRREYQVMVIGYAGYGAAFGHHTIETFAYRFNGPIVLVGPQRPDQFHLNPPAGLVSWRLGLSDDDWTPISAPAGVETSA